MKKFLLGIIVFFSFSSLVSADLAYNDYISCVYDQGDGNYVQMRFNNIVDITPTLQSFKFYSGTTATYDENSRDKFIYKASSNIDELKSFFINYDQVLVQDNETQEGYGRPVTTYTVTGYWATHHETYKNKNDMKNLCPSSLLYTTLEDGESYKFYACKEASETYYGENEFNNGEVLGCNLVQKYLSSKGESYSKMNYFTGAGSSTNINDKDDNDIQTQYNSNREEYEAKCSTEEDKKTNNKICSELEALLKLLENHGEETGISKDELNRNYDNYKPQGNFDYDENKACDSLLGKVTDKNAPAYYLHFAFNLIKYIAIVALLVLTVVEYVKAIASSNTDAIKKASQNTIKRLIIAVVIFLLPILIEFLFSLFGWTTDATCGI